MSERIEFGSLDAADVAREQFAEYVCPVDDGRRLSELMQWGTSNWPKSPRRTSIRRATGDATGGSVSECANGDRRKP